MSVTQQTKFLDELETITQSYNQNPTDAINRARLRANELVLETYFSSDHAKQNFEENMRSLAKEGKKVLSVVSWRKTDELKFNNRYLLDLLSKSDELISTIQDWLDDSYSQEDGRRFRVFYLQQKGQFHLKVSWNYDKFDGIDEIMRRNREITETNRQDRTHPEGHEGGRGPHNGGSHSFNQSGRPNGRGGGRGRGGFGRGRGGFGRGGRTHEAEASRGSDLANDRDSTRGRARDTHEGDTTRNFSNFGRP